LYFLLLKSVEDTGLDVMDSWPVLAEERGADEPVFGLQRIVKPAGTPFGVIAELLVAMVFKSHQQELQESSSGCEYTE
jgi:hypothetical protein